MFESVTLNKTGNFSLNKTIYIGIYAYTSSVYYLTFEPVYFLDYNVNLLSAVPMVDSISYYNYFVAEF